MSAQEWKDAAIRARQDLNESLTQQKRLIDECTSLRQRFTALQDYIGYLKKRLSEYDQDWMYEKEPTEQEQK